MDTTKTEHQPQTPTLTACTQVRTKPFKGSFDFERYAPLLDADDLSEDQKREFLQILWEIVSEFVALGFGMDPVNILCGQLEKIARDATPAASDAVDSTDKLSSKKFPGAASDGGHSGEGICHDQ